MRLKILYSWAHICRLKHHYLCTSFKSQFVKKESCQNFQECFLFYYILTGRSVVKVALFNLPPTAKSLHCLRLLRLLRPCCRRWTGPVPRGGGPGCSACGGRRPFRHQDPPRTDRTNNNSSSSSSSRLLITTGPLKKEEVAFVYSSSLLLLLLLLLALLFY